jgi:GT2 family glycosyltransferase
MKLSILIVNYNGRQFLDDCLESIRQMVTVEHEVIVVDNASVDGSCAYLQEFHPAVKLIESEKNLGFAGGNNLGSRQARGEYLLLLNNDTVLQNEILPAIDLLDRSPTIGNLGAMMLDGDKKYTFSAGYFPSPLRLIRLASLYRKDGDFRDGRFTPRPDSSFAVDWVAGSFLLTRRVLWDRVRGLDEGYFMYGEDVDYCRKTCDAGFSTVYYPQVSYVHYCGFEPSRLPMVIFGLLRYHKKYSRVLRRALAAAILYSGLVVRALLYRLLFILTGNATFGVRTNACMASLKMR